ncbi:hypothetical protein P170DRAFT_410681 [Aspergillus steynii IBT 23096]|uniref:Uncharacterized protein n=1 Tax=Aspergillus steynii IBT 23096 TaxID=1392250 RepID=A0A2I2G5C9_9EURO|nr:uncharacterized protein P170DRAFT_410681 [Aspergillus steynii IBT 23096]PLB48080.1 hypothetical protein P170DRAFT_410681 [Aspergillus steynii IBT 23096]
MAHLNGHDPAHLDLPPFAKPLAPYIKSRQEALRIRQALTVHLRSHIVFAEDNPDHPDLHAQSHLSLCAPQDAVVDVKRIPSEFTGLRREYLQALKANIEAKKAYQSISEASQNPPAETTPSDPTSDLQAYLRLLRDRRKHAKLQVFQHYLHQLKTRDIPTPEEFESNENRSQHLLAAEELGEGQPNKSEAGDGLEELVHKLERAVIRAKAQLDREKMLLEQLKAEQGMQGEIPPAAKFVALQRTRDELVQWVEEKLVSVGSGDDGPIREPPVEEIEESAVLLEEQKAQIAEQYGAYVEARKRLLDAASRACQPIANATPNPPERAVEPPQSPNEETPSLDPVNVLSFANDILLPLSKSQRALATQKFYLAGLLSKEKTTTLRMLNRLRDESHLLPEYPILARQPRFKNAASALNSRHAAPPSEPTKTDELVALAEAWAFASEAAGTNEREYVEHKVEEGSEAAEDAQQVLREVYGIMKQDLDETLRECQDEEPEDDIWAQEAQTTRSRGRMTRSEGRPKGPWAGLNGRVGLTDR